MSHNEDEGYGGTKEDAPHEEHNTSPSSSSSSPSPEFSFTVSLRTCSSSSDILLSPNGKTKSFAVDLSPADDIFFHGHLLPLQILSHLPISPRSSAHSRDAAILPKERFNGQENTQEHDKNPSCSDGDTVLEKHDGMKSRFSFMLSSLLKWRKGSEPKGGEKGKKASQKKRQRFELNGVLKRCTTMVKQTVLFHGRNETKAEKTRLEREDYRSYSGNLSLRHDIIDLRGNRGEYSAPVSTRTSPTNRGLLVPITRLSSSASDSSVEELHAAIEAAIAHCKKSFAIDEKSSMKSENAA
ncbi:PREDICTED: BRI1 kinase inhibitor 1-like [Tarenaya hassleriana]|uniref:BRI1 kinase inhibitor 1-like n=1 Tax=Tarenaya hassleriana TaxID=28532 RepID=UPI00053C3E64|nr:PREDICTED: BRI1 kinase inhibitor 1-like [Tarenaya hassleriana]